MARATTWAEFSEKQDSEKRVIVLIQGRELANPANIENFWFSNIEREEPAGFAGIIQKGVLSVPALRYNTNEIGGGAPAPSWSNIALVREDGYDISQDESGIYFDDLGTAYILENQAAIVWFGGDDLPFSEYKITFFGTMGSPAHGDMNVTIPCRGSENRAYRDTVAKTTVTTAIYPNAPTGSIGKTIPFCVGFVWNLEPVCVDGGFPNFLRFAFHDNSVPYSSVGVYDGGVILTGGGVHYNDLGDGTIQFFNYTPTGKVTCFALGAWAFSPWATIITNLLQTFAGTTPAQIDAAAVAAANIALPYAVAYAAQDEMSVMNFIRQLSVGIPAYYSFHRDGVFRMEEITAPSAKAPVHTINSGISNISPVGILGNSLSIKPFGNVIDTINFNYYENYAVTKRDTLSATLTETQMSLFYNEYRQDTYFDATIQTLYDNPGKKNLLMRVHSTVDTQSAASKWIDLLGEKRAGMTIKIKCQDLIYNIGDIVSVTFETELKDGTPWYRHGLNDTRLMIVGIDENYDRFETVLTLWG